MRTTTLMISLLALMLCTACDSDVPEERSVGGDTGTGGGDVGADTSNDTGEEDTVASANQIPTALSFASGGGTVESENFRVRFVLAAPIQGGESTSPSFQMLPLISTPAESQTTEEGN